MGKIPLPSKPIRPKMVPKIPEKNNSMFSMINSRKNPSELYSNRQNMSQEFNDFNLSQKSHKSLSFFLNQLTMNDQTQIRLVSKMSDLTPKEKIQ